jgi:hypothetical protein
MFGGRSTGGAKIPFPNPTCVTTNRATLHTQTRIRAFRASLCLLQKNNLPVSNPCPTHCLLSPPGPDARDEKDRKRGVRNTRGVGREGKHKRGGEGWGGERRAQNTKHNVSLAVVQGRRGHARCASLHSPPLAPIFLTLLPPSPPPSGSSTPFHSISTSHTSDGRSSEAPFPPPHSPGLPLKDSKQKGRADGEEGRAAHTPLHHHHHDRNQST